MTFRKGESGNPAGRPRGSRSRASVLVHGVLGERAQKIAQKVADLAEDGDTAAMRMCLDRIAPRRQYDPGSCELPSLNNAADSVEAMARIAEAVATGDLAPSEALALAKVVEIHLQALAVNGFEQRLGKVESLAENTADLPEPNRSYEVNEGRPKRKDDTCDQSPQS
jgi:hypothetical protein